MINRTRKVQPAELREKSLLNTTLAVSPTVDGTTPTINQSQKMGADLLDEATQEPTLDIYLRNPPNIIKEEDYPQIVAILQRKRELNIAAEQKRKDKRNGNEEVETTDA